MDTPKIVMWAGKRVDEMTREELIWALETLARLYEDQKKNYEHDMQVLA